ncbi:hypothetical protein [Maricaulis sp.]|uniref:hypothetical protein n=1 Tax=Maricaulis sp. TaxID=1486257 RepID=UPI002606F27B|nr:hypothetical protein [Maricaulis sp.]
MRSVWLAAASGFLALAGCEDLPASDRDAEAPPQVETARPELDNLLERTRTGSISDDAGVTERMAASAQAYMEAVAAARAGIADYPYREAHSGFEAIRAAVFQLDDWAAVIDAAGSHRLSEAQEDQRQALREELGRLQRRLLPRLRSQFVTPEGVLEELAQCEAMGPTGRIVRCIARDFRDHARMVRFHNQIRRVIYRLRFTETRYQPEIHSVRQFYQYELDVPADGEVVIWLPSGDYRDPA